MPTKRNRIQPQLYADASLSPALLHPVLTAESLLLADPKRNIFLKKIAQYTGLDDALYQSLYETTVSRFVECVQALPFQSGGKPGGLMDYSLERAGTALRHYHQSAGAEFSTLYAFALFTAALFQHIGKIISQQAVMISDREGKFIADWLPFEGSMVAAKAEFYKLRPISAQWINLGQSVTPLLACRNMPAAGFEWIASDYKILALWMGILSGEKEHEGELLHWLQLNHTLMRPATKDRSGIGMGKLDIQLTRPLETALAEDFLAWLSKGLQDGSISVNEPDAHVHRLVEGGLLLERKIFQRFSEIYGRSVNWVVICKQFNYLGLSKLSGSDFEFEKFFSKTPESLALENAARAPSGMFYNPIMVGVPPVAAVGVREGLVVTRPEVLYAKKSLPAYSNLTSGMPAYAANSMAYVQNRVNSTALAFVRKPD